MNDFKQIIDDINKPNQTYFFNSELLPIIKNLQSDNVMSIYTKEEILSICEKYKTHINDIATAIYKNEYVDKDVVMNVIDENQHQNVLMLVLGRRNIDTDAVSKVILILGRPYVVDRIDDFEFLMENNNAPFTHNDCPISQNVLEMLKLNSDAWHYIYEKYTKNVDKVYEILENDSQNEKRISAIAYNGNLPANIRNQAFDIAYDPSKLYKFATKHMANTLYFSAAEAFFETNPAEKDYGEITKNAEGILANLIDADKLSKEHLYDFACRFKERKSYNGVTLLEKVAEKTKDACVLKKILEIPKIASSNIGEKIFNNENFDYPAYESFIIGELLKVIKTQETSPKSLLVRNSLERVLDCYEKRHCVVPIGTVKALEDDCFKFVSLMTNKTNSKVKENLCENVFEQKTVDFFTDIKKSIGRERAYDVVFDLYKKSLFNTFMQNGVSKQTKSGISYEFGAWTSFMSMTKKRNGISIEEYDKISEIFKKHEKQMPKEFAATFRKELDTRAKHTAYKFEINKLLNTDFVATDTYSFNSIEIDIKKLSKLEMPNKNTIKETLKESEIDKRQLDELSSKILNGLEQIARGPIAERIRFYEVIENANILYKAIKEREQELIKELTKGDLTTSHSFMR